MNDKIVRLSTDLVLKIAAGEVVDRPASIVKELVENSIDAGATAITIEIKDGGTSYIRVVDNGKGIVENMVRLAFESHATSKIINEEDLFNVSTLGFRGEALASIAAVSKVHLTTRHKDDSIGTFIKNEGGLITEIKPIACAVGTSILVKDLFYNTPVRLKFLKKPSVETSSITDLVMRLILSKPNISFRYVNNGNIVYHSIGDNKLDSAISRIYSPSTAKKMNPIDYSSSGIVLTGYLGILDLERGNRLHQTFFINGRYFKSDLISDALESATKGFVTVSKFPSCVLNIDIPYKSVDVNVHPNKLEVRFENPEIIKNVVYDGIKKSLDNINIINSINSKHIDDEISTPLINNVFENISEVISSEMINKRINDVSNLSNSYGSSFDLNDSSTNLLKHNNAWEPMQETTAVKTQEKDLDFNFNLPIDEIKEEEKIKIIGTLFDSFILLECNNKFLMIDQHAAQERINFEKMMSAYHNKTISQAFLTPILIEINPREADIVRENMDYLFESGFDISFFDSNSLAIRAVPILLGEPMKIKDCLTDILKDWNYKNDSYSKEKTTEKILQSACKHSIKAGDKLSNSAALGLVKDMLKNNIAPTCPHGRPIIIEFSKNELYKKFKRIQ